MNKYLHIVASVGLLFTLNYDAWNHELKKKIKDAVCSEIDTQHIMLCEVHTEFLNIKLGGT